MKPVAELIAVPGKSFPALVFCDGFRELEAGTKLYSRELEIPKWLLHRLNDATKPLDAADRNLLIRLLEK